MLVTEEPPTVSFRLTKMTTVLGREDHCDLVIEEAEISRKHCLLETSEQYVKVKDLESSNGTAINGIAISDGYLRVGDRLSLGSYHLILQKEQKRAPEYNG
jgi:pSer/pThr/pTyr-binding forkhead associated (FHA) protein